MPKKKQPPTVTSNQRTAGQLKAMELLCGPMATSGATLAVLQGAIAPTGEDAAKVADDLEKAGYAYRNGASIYATRDAQGGFCWLTNAPPAVPAKPQPQQFPPQGFQPTDQQPQQPAPQAVPMQQQFQNAVQAPPGAVAGEDEDDGEEETAIELLQKMNANLERLCQILSGGKVLGAVDPHSGNGTTNGQAAGWPPPAMAPQSTGPTMPGAMQQLHQGQPANLAPPQPNPATWNNQMPGPGAPPVPAGLPGQPQQQVWSAQPQPQVQQAAIVTQPDGSKWQQQPNGSWGRIA